MIFGLLIISRRIGGGFLPWNSPALIRSNRAAAGSPKFVNEYRMVRKKPKDPFSLLIGACSGNRHHLIPYPHTRSVSGFGGTLLYYVLGAPKVLSNLQYQTGWVVAIPGRLSTQTHVEFFGENQPITMKHTVPKHWRGVRCRFFAPPSPAGHVLPLV